MSINFNKKKYKKLYKYCDYLLLNDNPGIDRVLIPWLHVVRAHPVFLDRYVNIFSHSYLSFLQRTVKKIKSTIQLFHSLIMGPIEGNRYWYGNEGISSNVDILFISHLTSINFANDGDMYFGNIQEKLGNNGISSVVGLINHTNTSSKNIESTINRKSSNPVEKIVFSRYINSSKEMSFFRRLRKESRKLYVLSQSTNNIFLKRVCLAASKESMSSSAVSSMRLFTQIEELISCVNPKAVVVTYEGHSWERGVFYAAKKINKKILRIGYYRTAPFKYQHSIGINFGDEYMADVILSSGVSSKNKLLKYKRLKGIPIEVLGSNSYQVPPVNINRNIRKVCLVIPEGVVSECRVLFNFSLRCAIKMPEFIFIWRLHPLLEFKQILDKFFNKLPENIILSVDSIENDIERSSYVIYRGSSAIIRSTSYGLKPFYVSLGEELTVDPLYKLGPERNIVENEDDFIKSISNGQDKDFSDKVVKFSSGILSPIDISTIKKIIK